MFSHHSTPRKSHGHRVASAWWARALVLRYGLLSHALLYKEARNEADQLEDVLQAGLLLQHEAHALQPLAAKPAPPAVDWPSPSHR